MSEWHNDAKFRDVSEMCEAQRHKIYCTFGADALPKCGASAPRICNVHYNLNGHDAVPEPVFLKEPYLPQIYK